MCYLDILLAIDRGDRELVALICLDLTAAFYTVDHNILLQRLQMSFGIKDVALQRDSFRTSIGRLLIRIHNSLWIGGGL